MHTLSITLGRHTDYAIFDSEEAMLRHIAELEDLDFQGCLEIIDDEEEGA